MDMPLQHAHPDVLRAMRRPSNGERYLEIIDEFRRRIPGVTMRSTFIVGFPGETEEHVAYLEEFIARAQLDRVGFFSYSREDGTPGATLPDQVPEREKRRRLVRLREAQRLASERARATRVGTTVRVLVEERRRLRRTDPIALALGTVDVTRRPLDGRSARRRRRRSTSPNRPVGAFVDVRLDGCGAFDFYGAARRGAAAGGRRLSKRIDETQRRSQRMHDRMAYILGAVLIVFGMLTGAVAYTMVRSHTYNPVVGIVNYFVPSPESMFGKERIFVLLMGLDYDYSTLDEPTSKDARTDKIEAFALDFPSKVIQSVAVPRDMDAIVNGHEDKINDAYHYGGAKNTDAVVGAFLGLPIDRARHILRPLRHAADQRVEGRDRRDRRPRRAGDRER